MKSIKLENLELNLSGQYFIRIESYNKLAHGLYLVDGIQMGFFDGLEVDLSYPDSECVDRYGFPISCYAAMDITFESSSGMFVDYTDNNGLDIGYYDLITQEFIVY